MTRSHLTSRFRRTARRRLARLHRTVAPGLAALTFDDGPSPYTAAVLDVLAAHEVPATFFVVGRNAQADPGLVRRILDEGHGLGSHSQTHPDPRTLPLAALWREYRNGRRAVEDIVGDAVPLFRPPHGHLGRFGSVAARAAGVQTWMWSRHAEDWEPDLTPDWITERLLPVHPGDVLVLHDGIEQPLAPQAVDRTAMIEGLDAFLAAATDDGVVFTRLQDSRRRADQAGTTATRP